MFLLLDKSEAALYPLALQPGDIKAFVTRPHTLRPLKTGE